MYLPFIPNELPVVNVSAIFGYAIFCHAPAPAVPPAISNLSSVLVPPHRNEYIYLQSFMSDSFAQFASPVLPAKLAQPHATIAPPRAVVGLITVQVFPLIEYRYIVTALFPIR